ncbi:MAG: TetR/AcrR family transcriptional regulator [Candidatus Hydrogenedentota bacterium]
MPPSSLPKWRRQPHERPAQILDAALDVFAEKGFHEARMDEIAERAGITKGTIYLYFESKEELFLAMVRTGFAEWVNLLPQITFEPSQDLEELGRNLGKTLLEALENPRFVKLIPVVLGELNHLPALKQIYREEIMPKANFHMAELLEFGMEHGVMKRLDAVAAARCLFGMYFGFILTQEVLGAKEITPMSRETIADTITTVYFRGILAENGETR